MGNENLQPWIRKNKETELQPAVKAGLQRGCTNHPLSRSPLEAFLQPLTPGQVLHRMLLLPLRTVLLRSWVNREASKVPWAGQPCCSATCLSWQWLLCRHPGLRQLRMPQGDFSREKCSFPSNKHRRRDVPMHTSSPSQSLIEKTRHLHRTRAEALCSSQGGAGNPLHPSPCHHWELSPKGLNLSPSLVKFSRFDYPTRDMTHAS